MKKDKLFLTCIIFWIILTFLRVLYHQPWYDEAHSWTLAQNYSVMDIISFMKWEGHLLIWYLLIMPFAKLDLWYPYSMQIINWAFALGALIVIWKKAPFNPWTKAIITFSFPFAIQLPVIARCYSVGVFLLVILACMYRNSLKHPIWYSVLIILCANTSVMALFGAAAFGLLFAYDLIRNALAENLSRKDFRLAFSIMAIGAVIVLWQLGGSLSHEVNVKFSNFFEEFEKFYYFISKHIWLDRVKDVILFVTLIFTPIILFIKNKKMLLFLSFTFICMMWCFIVKYSGYAHHYIFFWVYIMLAYWVMMNSYTEKTKSLVIAEVIMALFFAGQIFSPATSMDVFYNSESRAMYNKIKMLPDFDNSRIILVDPHSEAIVPYFRKGGADIFIYQWKIPASYAWNLPGNLLFSWDKAYMSASWLKDIMLKEKTNYILLLNAGLKNHNSFVVKDGGYSIKFEPVEEISRINILYKLTDLSD